MIHGIDLFRAHFADHSDKYVLIGGSASYLLMEDRGFDPRLTKDLDIVLTLEAIDQSFLKDFWQFVSDGGYQLQEKSTGEKRVYRFQKPTNEKYPFMLELFSRAPDGLELGEQSRLTPIPADEEVSSLSAILLDENYYKLIQANRKEIDGVTIVHEGCLIPLKAYAWIDLRARRERGEQVDSKNIKKHEGDILRLSQLLSPDDRFEIPELAQEHLREFLETVEDRSNRDLAAIGISDTMDNIKAVLLSVFMKA
ncbi:hypothetical protein C7U60_05070 [Mesorhizobium plurifarium]|uniref:hypothetical protein n=1 Tax=Sinorhizobium arboris TaxID=76745 RepID=UPI0004175C76|nr:hypothetical protein [Sinorhizobium arboris]PST26391.1 hypothetical protein C7U60_05070 [Mesorhizobium plurifarium]